MGKFLPALVGDTLILARTAPIFNAKVVEFHKDPREFCILRSRTRRNYHKCTLIPRIPKAAAVDPRSDQQAGAPANAYFEAVGGAGSATDLRLQGKALVESNM